MMRLGSLFTGAGGLDLAVLSILPVAHAWVCDNDSAAVRVLARHWPDVPNLGDITAVDWLRVEPVDVLAGGFPCTDISNAGRREGISGARSGLWSQYAHAVRVLRPRYVLVENVASLAVRGLDRVLADLAVLGFDAEWCSLPASAAGAPHRRDRLFLCATPQDADRAVGDQRRFAEPGQAEGRRPRADLGGRGGTSTTDTDRNGREGQPQRHREPTGTESQYQPQRLDPDGCVLEWGRFGPAIRAWERILGRPAPVPTITGARGGRVLNAVLAEWMMGLPDRWITGVPGLSRNEMLKLAGNGVVPHQAVTAFRWLLPLLDVEGAAA